MSCSVLIEGVPAARADQRSATLCMRLTTAQLRDATQLQSLVAQRCGIPAHRFMLSRNGRIVQRKHSSAAALDHSDDDDHDRTVSDVASSYSSSDEDEAVDPAGPLVLRFHLRSALVGGKGGFGALLRSSTTKVGAKKTSNFSASRDLSGRRMRHVEAEEAIAKWNAEHHDPVNQTELAAKFKAIKEGRSMEVRVCKWGPTCKYRYSTCRMEHGPDPDAEPVKEKVLSMAQQVPLSSLKAQMTRKEDMQDAVSAGIKSGLKRKARAASASASASSSADQEESKEQGEQTDSDEDVNDGYESSSGSESDSSSPLPPASKRAHTEPASSSAAAAASSSSSSAAAASASSYSAYSSAAASSSSSSSSSSSLRVLAVASYIPEVSSHAPAQLESIDAKQAQGGVAGALAKIKAKQQAQAAHEAPAPAPAAAAAAASSASSSSAAAAASSSASYAPIDLLSLSRHEDLLQFDCAHLGAELSRVGLKAGGTHEQRAQRLFLLRGSTLEQMPKKIRANS